MATHWDRSPNVCRDPEGNTRPALALPNAVKAFSLETRNCGSISTCKASTCGRDIKICSHPPGFSNMTDGRRW